MKLLLLLSLCTQTVGFQTRVDRYTPCPTNDMRHFRSFRLLHSKDISDDISSFNLQHLQLDYLVMRKFGLVLFLGTSMLFSPSIVTPARAETPTDVIVLNHDYSDPLHPQCRRTIQVDSDGKTFHYSGTAVGPKDDPVLRGCSPGEIKQFGLRRASFDGQIQMPGLQLSVGDGIHEGRWEPANSVTTPGLQFKAVDGIRWNDGNKWIVKEETPKPLTIIIGEWIFLAYIGFSTLAGFKGVFDKIQEKRNRAAN